VGSDGSENGQSNGVKSLAVDAQDNVYVADLGNKRIQVFDSTATSNQVSATSARR
jgi:DNA-binding beta-propeller fold protein YncE